MAASADQNVRTRQQHRWLEIGLIFVVFFIAGGAPAPHVNEAHYLAKAKHYWQPDWCANNLFLDSDNAHLTFYWSVGLLTKWFELPTVAWIGRIVAWLLLATAWQRLSRCISSVLFSSVFSAMLLITLIDWTNFSGEWVVGGVESKCFAYAFVFWGLAALAEGKWKHVWPCLGLASAFHVLVGGWSVVAAMVVWLCQPRQDRPTLMSMMPALLLGGAISLAGVLPALQLTHSTPTETVDQANQIYVFKRLPHHLAPLSKPIERVYRNALRFGLLLLGFAWLRFFCLRQPQETSSKPGSLRGLELIMRFAIVTLLISLLGLVWEFVMWNNPVMAAKLLKFYFYRLADVAIPVSTCLMVAWFVNSLAQRGSKWGLPLLVVATALPIAHLLDTSWTRYQNPRPPGTRSVKNLDSFRQACDWISKNTSSDSVFLAPKHAHAFKWYAGRSDVVAWKDIPQNAEDMVLWHKRFYDIYWYYNAAGEHLPYRSIAAQGAERIRKLAEKYDFDYVLTHEYPPLLLPVVYSNNHYAIYSTTSYSTTGSSIPDESIRQQ